MPPGYSRDHPGLYPRGGSLDAPLKVHLDAMVARATQHLEDSGMAAKI